MTPKPTPWSQLLGHVYEEAAEQYGEHTNEVISAFAALRETKWLAHAGAPLDSESVSTAKSWGDFVVMFREGREDSKSQYGPNGHLVEPVEQIKYMFVEVKTHKPEQYETWQKARRDATDFAGYSGYLPDWMATTPVDDQRNLEEAMNEYLYEFVSWLLAEIILQPAQSSPVRPLTYFREQLEWFHAGHVPCGWSGDWPLGLMRVF